ncbi:MAG: TetR/AcrR family transcriptional regulator [Actinobacteria bacterium]|nr:TetR/AcrR family transcriptional regulator [Actinomycetota bacterium]
MERPEPATRAREPLSKERVIRTAVQLADRGGLEALTMRKLADELGVGVMSLYYYVPNKDELIEGMVELVFSEIQLPPNDVVWKTAMRQRAISTREALNRHRWAVGLMESNPLPGPQSFRVHNAVIGCLREAGFSIELTIQAYSVLDAYIYGFALQEKTVPFDDAAGAAAVATEQVREFAADAEQQQSAALVDEFPYLAEVVAGHVTKVGHDFEESFDYGLDLILDALEKRRVAASA